MDDREFHDWLKRERLFRERLMRLLPHVVRDLFKPTAKIRYCDWCDIEIEGHVTFVMDEAHVCGRCFIIDSRPKSPLLVRITHWLMRGESNAQ